MPDKDAPQPPDPAPLASTDIGNLIANVTVQETLAAKFQMAFTSIAARIQGLDKELAQTIRAVVPDLVTASTANTSHVAIDPSDKAQVESVRLALSQPEVDKASQIIALSQTVADRDAAIDQIVKAANLQVDQLNQAMADAIKDRDAKIADLEAQLAAATKPADVSPVEIAPMMPAVEVKP